MTLFEVDSDAAQARAVRQQKTFSQYLTPEWASQSLVDQFFSDLTTSDVMLEPTCGRGSFLKAIPLNVRAIGIELDPELAAAAASETGRIVICGDFRTIELPERPTHIVGNPPFSVKLLDELLERAAEWLPDNGRCGLILGTQMVQTPSTVLRWNERWSMQQHILPRTLFPRSIRPLVFLMFTKDRQRRMLGGFALYRESVEINAMSAAAKLILVRGTPNKSCWRSVVEWALRRCGGRAHLRELYNAIEPHRPTENRWWQEKVRQTLQRHFSSAGDGVWQLSEAA